MKKLTLTDIFDRNRIIILIIFTLTITIIFDFLAGLLLIPKNQNIFRSPHYYYHHGLLPNQKAVTRWGTTKYSFYTNSLGFRDSSTKFIPLRTQNKRFLFIGDSFTEGVGVTYEESFPGLLANELSKSKIEILNASVVSYSPVIYYYKTKFLIENLGLTFDELFVFIDIADIVNELTYYRNFKPADDEPKQNLTSKLNKYLKDKSLIYYVTTGFHKNHKTQNFPPHANTLRNNQLRMDVNEQKSNAINHKEGIWTVQNEYFEKFGKYGLQSAKRYMKDLLLLCMKRNIKMTIAVYPWPLQIYKRDIDSIHVRAWREFANENALGFINLFPVFINNQLTFDQVYDKYFILGDIHWNPTGHRIVANKVMAYIRGK